MPTARPVLSRSLTLLLATATGLTVASNYYAQPLLHTIAAEFALQPSQAGLIVLTAQLTYGVGLFLLVPLGDLLEQRRLVVWMTLLSAAGLLLSSLAPSSEWLLTGTAITGLFSVAAQVLVPMAASMAEPHRRGRVVGTLMSGLLLGILLARTAAGTLSDLGGWRSIYALASVLMACSAFGLWRALPERRQYAGLGYPALLGSVLQLFLEFRVLRIRAILGLLSFCLFALFWTPLAFLLAMPPYGFSDTIIGLFGLAGAAGALAASLAGRLADRGKAGLTTWGGLLLLLLAWVPLAWAEHSLLALLAGVLVLDLAVQLVHVTNQNAVYALRPDARNRLNAGYITCYFIGGAVGSLLGARLYQSHGWDGVVVAGFTISSLELLIWGCSQWSQRTRTTPAAPLSASHASAATNNPVPPADAACRRS